MVLLTQFASTNVPTQEGLRTTSASSVTAILFSTVGSTSFPFPSKAYIPEYVLRKKLSLHISCAEVGYYNGCLLFRPEAELGFNP